MRAPSLLAPRSILLAGVLAALPLPALAQATADEAARLQAIGETYFGKPAAGEPGVVTVTVEGDHYRAGLDMATLVRRLMASAPADVASKFTFDWPAPSLALAPRGDGTWRFWDHRIPKLTLDADGQRTELVTEGIEFETITDPATGVTPSMKGRFARVTATSTIKKPDDPMAVTSESVSADVTVDGSARPAATPGAVDVVVHQTVGSLLYAIETSGGANDGIPDMRVALTGGRRDDVMGVRGLRYPALLDLWAHLVAHHEREDFTTGQGALKAKIAAALPIFEQATQKIAATDFALESPFGIAKAAKAALDFDLAGLTRDGRFTLSMGLSGFQAYSLFMPKWSQKLVPSDMTLTGRVSGYDVATPLSHVLEHSDFAAEKPMKPEDEAKVAALFLPRGVVEIVVDGNRLTGPLYDLTVDGRMTAGPDGAKGAVTVKAKGLDKVADHLAKAERDEQSKALAGMVAVARQFAERKGDEHVWRFDFDGNRVAVNGKPLK